MKFTNERLKIIKVWGSAFLLGAALVVGSSLFAAQEKKVAPKNGPGSGMGRYRVPSEGEPLAKGPVPEFELEVIGPSNGRPWYKLMDPYRASENSPWRQLIWFKKEKRTTPRSYFAAVDFERGTIKEFPQPMPAMLLWAQLWVGGKYYLGLNGKPHLAVYDPEADTLKDLGLALPGSAVVYRMEVGPSGELGLGGGGGTDLAVYDPRTSQFTHYGKVGGAGAEHGYVYYLSLDADFIYCAIHGTGPKELLAIHRRDKTRTVLASVPAAGWVAVSGPRAEVVDVVGENKVKTFYYLHDGKAKPFDDAAKAEISRLSKSVRVPAGSPPAVLIDESPIARGESAVMVRVTSAKTGVVETKLKVGLTAEEILDLAVLDDGRISGVARGYGAMVIADPEGRKNELVAIATSCYTNAVAGGKVFAGGYPSTKLVAYDPQKAMTSFDPALGSNAVPFESKAANPRLVHQFAADAGGAHVALCLTPAADGRVYLAARRHRYFYGFSLAWCDAATYATGVIKDGGVFDHYQIGWISPLAKGNGLVIATRVQYNKQVPGEAAQEGAVFVFDTKTQKVVAKHVPLPKVKSLLGVVETGPNTVVGVGQQPDASSVLYRLNLQTGKVEQTRVVRAVICGTDGGDMAVPARSNGFILGPDGMVWAAATDENMVTMIFRVDPKDLSIQPVGTLKDQHVRFVFQKGRLYLGGGGYLRRVRNLDTLVKLN